MKKLSLLLAAAVAAFSLASCYKSEVETPQKDIEFDITVSSPLGAGTKAVKTGWTSGDKIFIWLDGSYAKKPEVTITYNGTKWEGSIEPGVELQLKGSMKYLYLSTNTLPASVQEFTVNTAFNFPQIGTYYKSPMVLASNLPGTACPTYQYADGKLTMVLDFWKYLTNAQVTIPIKEGLEANNLRLGCYKTGIESNTGSQVQLMDSGISIGSGGALSKWCSIGQDSPDGAVFYFYFPDMWFTEEEIIEFRLYDVSSGSTVYYKYTTSTKKAAPLSNGVPIIAVTGGCAQNAFSAIKIPVFNGEADSNWVKQ